MPLNDDLLKDEDEIVWLENIEDKDYVRQTLNYERFRARPIKYGGNGRTVGYATLRDDAKSHESGIAGKRYFYRRVFYLTVGDRDNQPDGPYAQGSPSEAIDPRTVKPGVAGHKTPRVDGENKTKKPNYFEDNRERFESAGLEMARQFMPQFTYPPHFAWVVSEALKHWPSVEPKSVKTDDSTYSFYLLLICNYLSTLSLTEREEFLDLINRNVDNLKFMNLVEE